MAKKVLYKKKRKGNMMEKINARWEHDIFVGVRPISREVWVATTEGILKTRSVRRVPVEERWSEDTVKWVRCAP